MSGHNAHPKLRCKRCDKPLRYYKEHQLCSSCHFLKQFRPWEYDPEAWEARVRAEAKILK